MPLYRLHLLHPLAVFNTLYLRPYLRYEQQPLSTHRPFWDRFSFFCPDKSNNRRFSLARGIQRFKGPAWKLYLFSCVKLLSLLVAPVWSLVLDWRFVRSPRARAAFKSRSHKARRGSPRHSLCHWNHKLCLPTPSQDTLQPLMNNLVMLSFFISLEIFCVV